MVGVTELDGLRVGDGDDENVLDGDGDDENVLVGVSELDGLRVGEGDILAAITAFTPPFVPTYTLDPSLPIAADV
jgi:hypothetical protein